MALLRDAQRRVQNVNSAIEPYKRQTIHPVSIPGPATPGLPRNLNPDIHAALDTISPSLANSYTQIYLDLSTTERVSWAGTAQEIREVLLGILHNLAPDDEVKEQEWFAKQAEDGRPTHRQRVRFILRKRKAGSNEQAVAENAAIVDEMVERLVRETYTRASGAAHGIKDRTETRRILGYFEAFAHDLLDLP